MKLFKENIVKTNEEIANMKKDKDIKVFLRLLSRSLGIMLIIYSLGYIFGAWLASGTVNLDGLQGTLSAAVMGILLSFIKIEKEN